MNNTNKSVGMLFLFLVAFASLVLYTSTAVDALTATNSPKGTTESATETQHKIITHPEVVKKDKAALKPVPDAETPENRSPITSDPANCKDLPLNREKYNLDELSALKEKCKVSGY